MEAQYEEEQAQGLGESGERLLDGSGVDGEGQPGRQTGKRMVDGGSHSVDEGCRQRRQYQVDVNGHRKRGAGPGIDEPQKDRVEGAARGPGAAQAFPLGHGFPKKVPAAGVGEGNSHDTRTRDETRGV